MVKETRGKKRRREGIGGTEDYEKDEKEGRNNGGKKRGAKKNEAISGERERKEETINYFSDMSLMVSL